ncbi:MAG: AAA family ATPase [Candidatus Altiarchaeota archaeon]|nr:AAA family ATPase [Candidatus Altiarchaeota archaeon]
MKIQRVETRSFAISEGAEKRQEKRLRKNIVSRLVNSLLFKEKTEIVKAYRPLAKYRVSRMEETHKGVVGEQVIYETKENHFYVDLANADLYMTHGHMIKREDILRKIINLPPVSVRTLGALMRTSFLYAENLDQNAIMDLAQLNYLKDYKDTWLMLFKGIWDELNPEEQHKTVVKERVKAEVHLPKFNNKCYDMSNSISEVDTIDDTYKKDNIRYSIDMMSQLLTNLFEAKVVIKGITFIPYMQAFYKRKDRHKIKSPERYFPVRFIHDPFTKIKPGVKLKPVALSVSISAEGSIPIEEPTIDFSDVGGMEEVKKEITESLLYPLMNPELAKDFGKKSGGAILLYGPPGCGKTYIAKATIGESGMPFFNVNISEIVERGVQAEAESLHKVFEEASKNSPAVIFFDELDAIGGRREGAIEYAEKMEIDQFLMEMDGVETLGKDVLIIAATNEPWNIDPALRRSVRFTKHIFIPSPDQKAREEIFRIHTKDKPLAVDVDFKRLAELTEDYSSSDIKAICEKAAEKPWEEALKGGKERKINMRDFQEALKKQKSSLIPWFKMAYKELKSSGEERFFEDLAKQILKYGGGVDEAEKPEIDFSDVGGMGEVKEEIKKLIVYPITDPELAKQYRKEVGGSLLLYGPPGCGKTYIARATAGECSVAFFNIKLTDILSDRVGESEKNIQGIFERASRNTPSILFFDELDAITGRRDQVSSESGRRLIDSFLTELDGFKKTKGLVIMAATNAPWNIDPALRRSERFTKQMLVPPPDREAREDIFRIHTKDKPLAVDVDFTRLAELTEGYAASDIKVICDQSTEIPWQEALKGGEERRINMEDFVKVIKECKTSLTPWYHAAEKQITESGEAEFYSELVDDIRKSREKGEERQKTDMRSEREELKKLIPQRGEVERKIEAVRKKFYERELDEYAFSELMKEYEKQLIEIEVKMEILKERDRTRASCISP